MVKKSPARRAKGSLLCRLRRFVLRAGVVAGGLVVAWVVLFAIVPPKLTPYQFGQYLRLGPLHKEWVDWEGVSPEVAYAALAARDAGFCGHWGFDMAAIRRAAKEEVPSRSVTITQRAVSDTFLWPGEGWLARAAGALLTPLVEMVWSKQRILEVYLNVAEFEPGLFGVQAASRRYFARAAGDLTLAQAAHLAARLPGDGARDPGQIVAKAQALAAREEGGCISRAR